MPDVNWLAVLAAAISAFLLGGLWYSPALFGKAWQRGAGLTDEQLKGGNPAKIYGGEGIAQLLFFEGDEEPAVAYADRQGKYQHQTGVTLPKL